MKQTFDYDNQLPVLPVPHITDTCEKLLTWVKPIVERETYEETVQAVTELMKQDGAGEVLQQQLLRWDTQQTTSWIKPLWEESYLEGRASLPVTMNFNVLIESISNGLPIDYAEVAAQIGVLTAKFYHRIIDEEIAPEKMRNMPLDMGQFKKFFRSARVPKSDRDRFYIAPFDKRSNYFIVLYKNNVLKVPVTNETGELYDITSITTQLRTTMDRMVASKKNVGLFTVAERNEAAAICDILHESKGNATILHTMYDALFVISIDEESSNSMEAIHQLMLGMDNKFYDKTVQIVLTKHGEIGFNLEHTAIDGTSISTFIHYITEQLHSGATVTPKGEPLTKVEHLEWEITDSLRTALEETASTYRLYKDDIAILFEQITHIGAEQMKQFNMSPDAFFHLALQLAYYRTYGTFRSVYEPVSVRTFKGGRTECARATSEEKSHVVHAIEDGAMASSDIYKLMQRASDAHSNRLQACQEGFGVERHLFGLEKMYEKFGDSLGITEKPAIFSDEGYKKLRYDSLSTSGMNYKHAVVRMFAPTVKHGHGVAYMLEEDSLTISISSFQHNEVKGEQLLQYFLEAIDQLTSIAKEATNS